MGIFTKLPDFGHGTAALFPALHRVGARDSYLAGSWEKIARLCCTAEMVSTPPGLGDGKIRQSKPTYLAGIDFTPTDHNLIYLKFSTGYKSGGFNSNGSAPSVDYGPENVYAWELGTKNRFAGARCSSTPTYSIRSTRGIRRRRPPRSSRRAAASSTSAAPRSMVPRCNSSRRRMADGSMRTPPCFTPGSTIPSRM